MDGGNDFRAYFYYLCWMSPIISNHEAYFQTLFPTYSSFLLVKDFMTEKIPYGGKRVEN